MDIQENRRCVARGKCSYAGNYELYRVWDQCRNIRFPKKSGIKYALVYDTETDQDLTKHYKTYEGARRFINRRLKA